MAEGGAAEQRRVGLRGVLVALVVAGVVVPTAAWLTRPPAATPDGAMPTEAAELPSDPVDPNEHRDPDEREGADDAGDDVRGATTVTGGGTEGRDPEPLPSRGPPFGVDEPILLLSTHRTRIIDLRAGTGQRLSHHPDVDGRSAAGGGQDTAVEVIGAGDQVVVAHPDGDVRVTSFTTPGDSWSLGRAERVVASTDDRHVWLVTQGPDGEVVREVSARDGSTGRVGARAVPAGWNVRGAVGGGLVLTDHDGWALWNPWTPPAEVDSAVHEAGTVLAVGRDRWVVWCPAAALVEVGCAEVAITHVSSGTSRADATRTIAAEDARVWSVTAPAVVAGDHRHVALVDVATGQAPGSRAVVVDVRDGRVVDAVELAGSVHDLAWSPTGDLLVAASARELGIVSLRDGATWAAPVGTSQPHRLAVGWPRPTEGPGTAVSRVRLRGRNGPVDVLVDAAGDIRGVDVRTRRVLWTLGGGAESRLVGGVAGLALVRTWSPGPEPAGSARIEARAGDGEVRWSLAIAPDDHVGRPAHTSRRNTVIIPVHPAARRDGAASRHPLLHAVDVRDGTLRWTQGGLVGEVWADVEPAITDDGLVVAATSAPGGAALVYAFVNADGAPRWSAEVAGAVDVVHAEDDTVLVAAGADRRVWSLDAADGSERWSVDLSGHVPDDLDDRITVRLETVHGDAGATVHVVVGDPWRAVGVGVRVDARTGEVTAIEEHP